MRTQYYPALVYHLSRSKPVHWTPYTPIVRTRVIKDVRASLQSCIAYADDTLEFMSFVIHSYSFRTKNYSMIEDEINRHILRVGGVQIRTWLDYTDQLYCISFSTTIVYLVLLIH